MTKRAVRIIEVDGRLTTPWVEKATAVLRVTGLGEEYMLRGRLSVLEFAQRQLADALDAREAEQEVALVQPRRRGRARRVW
ncbi:hypothetical protein KKE45_04060 [Patescibacteria group bacterium]|nr:hypothetical protein [Patescibacteria group bacterium]